MSVRTFAAGDCVEANRKGEGGWYSGTISRCNEDGTYDIEYDDGDDEEGVPLGHIRGESQGESGGSSDQPQSQSEPEPPVPSTPADVPSDMERLKKLREGGFLSLEDIEQISSMLGSAPAADRESASAATQEPPSEAQEAPPEPGQAAPESPAPADAAPSEVPPSDQSIWQMDVGPSATRIGLGLLGVLVAVALLIAIVKSWSQL